MFSSQRSKGGKLAFAIIAAILLFAMLSWLLYFGVTGDLLPRGNTIRNKDSYTMTAEKLLAKRNDVVATMGDYHLTNGQLMIFYTFQVQEYTDNFSDQINPYLPLDQQIYDQTTGLTWQHFFLECALNAWKQYRILATKAEEAGFVMAQEDRDYLDGLPEYYAKLAEQNNYESVDALVQDELGEGCYFDEYLYFMELYYTGLLYVNDIVEKLEFSPEQLEAYFAEHEADLKAAGVTKDTGLLVDLRRITLQPGSESDTPTEEKWEACRLELEALLQQWLDAGKTDAKFAELATNHSKDTYKSNGGVLTNVYKDYFTKVDIRHILIMPEGGTTTNGVTTYSEEEWEACRQKAQAIYDTYLSGKKTEDRFSQLAKEHSKDGNAEQGGIYKDVSKNTMVEEFDAWIFDASRKPGDTGLVKTQYGYHVMYFVHRDSALNDWLYDEERVEGDYALIRTDDSYILASFIASEEAWIRFSTSGLRSDKFDILLEELSAGGEISTKYWKIGLGSLV